MARSKKNQTLKERIFALYHSNSSVAHKFRYGLLALDLITVSFLVISTFFDNSFMTALDIIFGLYLALDYMARFWIYPRKITFVINPLNVADFVAMISFLAPLLAADFGFLRGLRVLRLLRSYRVQQRLKQDFPYFKRNEDVIMSASNLFIFIFIMTELVYVSQHRMNPNVENFVDAMYFTIATLTTTGFGDVTLDGTTGKMLSILIMIFGVSLFLRLAQTIFRPPKVHYDCKECGLSLHENDAIHCKHCGAILNIPTEGVS